MTKHSRPDPVAKLVPFDLDTSPRRLDGIWQGRVYIAEDFDDQPEAGTFPDL